MGILWPDQPIHLFRAFRNFFKPKTSRTLQGLFGNLSRPLLGGYPETWQIHESLSYYRITCKICIQGQCAVPLWFNINVVQCKGNERVECREMGVFTQILSAIYAVCICNFYLKNSVPFKALIIQIFFLV